MNEQSSFERLVADQIGSANLGAPPEFAIDQTIARAGGTRRLPRWLALIKETPMRTSSSLAVGSPIARAAAVMVATLLLAIVVVGGSIAGSRVLASDGQIVVDQDGSGDATTITEAVAMAADGDEILIKPGTYAEAIRVDKDIIVRGDGDREAVIIAFPPDSPALTFTDGTEGDPDDPLIEYSVPVGVWMAAPSAQLSGVTVSGPLPGIGIAVTDGVAQLADLVIVLDGLDAEETDDPALDTRLAVAVVGCRERQRPRQHTGRGSRRDRRRLRYRGGQLPDCGRDLEWRHRGAGRPTQHHHQRRDPVGWISGHHRGQ